MEFGIFQGASVGPKPWDLSEPARIRNDIELGVVADRVGFDYFWAPEHHSLEEYSHSSCSHLACLAVGMKTQRIRLATGIFNLCPAINHPVRVAEQIAMIDVLTNGRIELGTGRGSGSTEVNTFGLKNEETKEMWDEAIRAIPKMWTQDLFSWQGKYFSVPERVILPRVVQKPHPPLWVTATNPATIEDAGKKGIGVAMFNFVNPERMRPAVEIYKRNIAKCEPISEVVNDKIMTIATLLCTEDGDEARASFLKYGGTVSAHFPIFFDTVPEFAKRQAQIPRPIPQSKLREMIRQAALEDIDSPYKVTRNDPEHLYKNGICVGNPDEVAATIQRYIDVGFDQLVLIPVIGFHQPQAQSIRSIELVGEKVLPKLRARVKK
jgi:alkanesulfonate monooxygenase SsuD/methylene tetrahydromethanopterin reductase-like flavin-dependent oxidoreductase (luciferase family)